MRNAIKKTTLKRNIIIVLLVMCVIGSLELINVSASCKDTEGTYKVSGYGYRWTESARKKEDYTSSYQKCLSCTRTYQSWVYGSNKSVIKNTDENYHNSSILKRNLKDPKTGKRTPVYTFNKGTTRYMINYVKENKLKYAGMMFMTGNIEPCTAHILWSPDSV